MILSCRKRLLCHIYNTTFNIFLPETVGRQTVSHEVPVEVAVPGDVDADDAALDGQLGEISSGKFDDVAENEDWAISLLRVVVLKKYQSSIVKSVTRLGDIWKFLMTNFIA